MASAVDSRLAYARLSAVATASRLPTANRGSNNSYTTSWDTTSIYGLLVQAFGLLALMESADPRLILLMGLLPERPCRLSGPRSDLFAITSIVPCATF